MTGNLSAIRSTTWRTYMPKHVLASLVQQAKISTQNSCFFNTKEPWRKSLSCKWRPLSWWNGPNFLNIMQSSRRRPYQKSMGPQRNAYFPEKEVLFFYGELTYCEASKESFNLRQKDWLSSKSREIQNWASLFNGSRYAILPEIHSHYVDENAERQLSKESAALKAFTSILDQSPPHYGQHSGRHSGVSRPETNSKEVRKYVIVIGTVYPGPWI